MLLMNPYVVNATPENLLALLDPRSQATLSLRNYAPVRPLLNALEWRLFPQNSLAYHSVNIVLHAAATLLLVALFRRSGIPVAAAALAGGAFLLHPANVEAVAWMSQIWGPAGLALASGALLAHPRRPALGACLFGLALLTRPTAVSALPAALAFAWARGARGPAGERLGSEPPPARWGWLGVWGVLLAAYAAAEFLTFAHTEAGARAPLHPDALVRLRTIASIAMRYLVMAATSHGVAAFHEAQPALSPLDPWWLGALVALGVLGARTLAALRARREEAAYWIWALAAFAPVSQVFPFLHPMADRYLYFMLPGLLGGVLCAGRALGAGLAPPWRARAAAGAVVLAALGLALFGALGHERAKIWRSEDAVLLDSARRYPGGVSDSLLRARASAQQGDVEGTLSALRTARAHGWDYFSYVTDHPAFEAVRRDPRIQELIRDFAAQWIETAQRRTRVTQMDLRDLARAHELRGELEPSIEALERAVALGGPLDADLRRELARVRGALRRAQRDAAPPREAESPPAQR